MHEKNEIFKIISNNYWEFKLLAPVWGPVCHFDSVCVLSIELTSLSPMSKSKSQNSILNPLKSNPQ